MFDTIWSSGSAGPEEAAFKAETKTEGAMKKMKKSTVETSCREGKMYLDYDLKLGVIQVWIWIKRGWVRRTIEVVEG